MHDRLVAHGVTSMVRPPRHVPVTSPSRPVTSPSRPRHVPIKSVASLSRHVPISRHVPQLLHRGSDRPTASRPWCARPVTSPSRPRHVPMCPASSSSRHGPPMHVHFVRVTHVPITPRTRTSALRVGAASASSAWCARPVASPSRPRHVPVTSPSRARYVTSLPHKQARALWLCRTPSRGPSRPARGGAQCALCAADQSGARRGVTSMWCADAVTSPSRPVTSRPSRVRGRARAHTHTHARKHARTHARTHTHTHTHRGELLAFPRGTPAVLCVRCAMQYGA